MAKKIEQLEISIETAKATSEVDKLTKKLSKLSVSFQKIEYESVNDFASGINRLASGMQKMNGIKTTEFTRLAKNIQKLGNIDTTSLEKTTVAVSNLTKSFNGFKKMEGNTEKISSIASNLSKLGDKEVKTAMSNIPRLATALKKLVTTLSKCPSVSDDIVQITKALGQLANQSEVAENASDGVAKATDKVSKAVEKENQPLKDATKNTFNLSDMFSKLKEGAQSVAEGIQKLYASFEDATNVFKSFNAYTDTFEQIASKWDKDYENYGSENAKRYCNTFVKQMNGDISKMSGLNVNLSDDMEGGVLAQNNQKNLGLNLQEVTQYASQFASISDAMGQTGEVSMALSSSFIKLAGDISSYNNIDYSTAAEALQSALLGQTDALSGYGVGITEADLQNKAYALGLSKSVSQMSQAEKMQLTLLSILQNSTGIWGDLAQNIGSPYNMIRQFTTCLKECAVLIGQMFTPILQKVIPIFNGIAIGVKGLLTNIARLFGIDVSYKKAGDGANEIASEIENVSSGFEDATSRAEAFKGQLQGFDKLNVISSQGTNDVSSSDSQSTSIDLSEEIMGAAGDYGVAWNEAFTNMESRAETFGKKVSTALEPVEEVFESFAVGDYFQVGQNVSAIVVGITNFFAEAIRSVDWKQIGKNIGSFIAGIEWTAILASVGGLIWEGLKAAFELYTGIFDAAPIETALLTALGVLQFTGLGSIILGKISSIIPMMSTELSKQLPNIIATFKATLGSMMGNEAATSMLAFIPNSGSILAISAVVAALAVLAVGLGVTLAKNEEVKASFENAMNSIQEGMVPLIETFTTVILPSLAAAWNGVLEILQPLGEFIGSVFVSIWQDMLNPALEYIGVTVLPLLAETLENTWNNIIVPLGEFLASIFTPIIAGISWALELLWMNVIVPLAEVIGTVLGKAFEGIVEIWNASVVPALNAVIAVLQFLWNEFMIPFIEYLSEKWGPVFEIVFKGIKGVIKAFSKILGGIIDFITGTFSLNWNKAWGGICDIFLGVFNGILEIAEGVINLIIHGINSILDNVNEFLEGVGAVIDIDLSIPKIPEIDIPTYAHGGFPEDGWFRASHGEIMGRFDNGQSVVANNMQITEGIARGVRNANSEQNILLREQNALLRQILAKDSGISTRSIFEAVRTENRNYMHRNGQSAFV